MRLHGLTGPCRHIAVISRSLSRQMPDDRLHFLQPAPFPIRGQSLRILGCPPCSCRRYRNDIQPGRSIGQYNVGNSLFQQFRTGSSGSTHHIVVATNGIAATHNKSYFVPVGNPIQNCLHLGRKYLYRLFRSAVPDRLYGFQYTCRLHAETARFLFIQQNPILPGLQHKSGMRLIERSDILQTERNRYCLLLPRRKAPCFCKSGQCFFLVIQRTVRLGNIDLQNILAGVLPCIGHSNRNMILRNRCDLIIKIGIAQAITKGISGANKLLLKPPISYKNPLGIVFRLQISVSITEGVRTWIISIVNCPGVGQLSAGANCAGKNICQSVPPLGTALPKKEYRIHGDLIQNREIHHASAVQYQNKGFIVLSEQPQTVFFYIRKQIVSLFHAPVMSFSRLTRKDVDGRVCFIRYLIRKHRSTRRIGHWMVPYKAKHLHCLKNVIFSSLSFQFRPPIRNIFIVLILETIHPQRGGVCKPGSF